MGYFPLNESSMNVKWTWTIFAAFAVPRKLNVAENKDILGCRSALYNTKPGWWFGTWILFFHILGIIIPTDFHIFQRGRAQPPTSHCRCQCFSIIWVNHSDLIASSLECQWIGLRENLQESPMIFMGKPMVSCKFSLKPIHWEWDDCWYLLWIIPPIPYEAPGRCYRFIAC